MFRVSRAALLLILFCFPVAAIASDWTVAQSRQPALYTLDNETWQEIRDGMAVPNAAWVYTGPKGRLLLTRNAEKIMFRPETMASIVSRGTGGGRTDIGQQFGSLLLDIEKRNTPHTTVHTPFLAAVVKGTQFEVNVGRDGAAVRVDNGTVEVTDTRHGRKVDVRKGQSVDVKPAGRGTFEVKGVGEIAEIVSVEVAAARAPVATKADAPSLDATKDAEGGSSDGTSFDLNTVEAAAATTVNRQSILSKITGKRDKTSKTTRLKSTQTETVEPVVEEETTVEKTSKQADIALKKAEKASKQARKAEKDVSQASIAAAKAERDAEKADRQKQKAARAAEEAAREAEEAARAAEKAARENADKAARQAAKAAREAEKEAEKAARQAQKEAEKAAKAAEKAAREKAAKEAAEKAAAKADKEAKKAAREAEKAARKAQREADKAARKAEKEAEKATKTAQKEEKKGKKDKKSDDDNVDSDDDQGDAKATNKKSKKKASKKSKNKDKDKKSKGKKSRK